jgi:hypothetical protein
MSKSKSKGYRFECEIAKKLSDWSGMNFVRVPASGALRWNNDETWIYGDVLPPSNIPIVIECKFHANISLENLLRQDSKIIEWWKQCEEDSKRANENLRIDTQPVVIFRRNLTPSKIMMREEFFQDVLFGSEPDLVRAFAFYNMGPNLVVADLDSFLAGVTVDRMIEYFS